MARHADAGSNPYAPYPPSLQQFAEPERPRNRIGLIAAAVVAVLVVAFCLPFVFPSVLGGVRSTLPWFPAAACTRTTVVEVVSVPLVEPSVSALTAGLQGERLKDDSCLSVRVRTQASPDTVSSSAVLPPSQAPQLWVSDSSLWLTQISKWKQRVVGSFGTSPVIMVSSAQAVRAGKNAWTTAKPGWADMFTNARPLSVPDLAGHAQGQLSMIALWQAAGKSAIADRAVAAAVIASRTSPYASEDDALSAIVNPADGQPDEDAPFVVTTEQAMVAINRDSMREVLTPLYPSDGSPYMDYPVVRLADDLQDAAHRDGTDRVVAALSSAQARTDAKNLGLRNAQGGDAPTSQRGLPPQVKPLTLPSVADLTRFEVRFSALAIPSRMLVAMDVSLSMKTKLPGSGLTRLEAAGRAAAAVGGTMTPASSVGLWAFALNMDGAKPYRQLAPIASLQSQDGALTHRQAVQQQLLTMDGQLTGGGTGLYVTAVAAIRAVRATYDERAANSVVVFTDGTNENDPRLNLQQTILTLQQETQAAPKQPVRLICIGLGQGIDFKALQAMADATGGAAYQAATAQQLQQVLYDAMSRRA